jgi:hypothetical protein
LLLLVPLGVTLLVPCWAQMWLLQGLQATLRQLPISLLLLLLLDFLQQRPPLRLPPFPAQARGVWAAPTTNAHPRAFYRSSGRQSLAPLPAQRKTWQ